MAWYVVRTNIKCEDKAEKNLRLLGYGTYAPWQRFEKWNRRKSVHIVRQVRLAPRYLFLDTGALQVDETPWGLVRACEGVECVLGINGAPHPLSGDEVKALNMIMAAEADFAFDETRAGKLHRREIGKTKKETTRMKYPAGTKVRINDGPFATFSGEVTNVTGRGMVEVITMLFGRLTPVELEPSQVEKLASAA